MPEVPAAVKTIATPASSQAAITSSSRCDPPGWMIAVTPASIASAPSANGKNASEASTASQVDPARGLVDRDADRVDAAHLAGADSRRRRGPWQHDRVRAHVLADLHANSSSPHSSSVGLRA